jgi:hypothetical protein
MGTAVQISNAEAKASAKNRFANKDKGWLMVRETPCSTDYGYLALFAG